MIAFGHQIDMMTMLFVNALTSFVSALLFLGFRRAANDLDRPASLLLWGIANMLLAAGIALWRHADLPRRPPARLAAGVHCAWAFVLVLRIVAALFWPEDNAASTLSSVAGLVVRLLLTWMIAICLLWMIARQLNA